MAGWADLAGIAYGTAIKQAAPSVALAGVARPSEYAFIFDAGYFDAFHGVNSDNTGIGWCYSVGADANGNSLDEQFLGFSPKHNNKGRNTCDLNNPSGTRGYELGFANICFMDGHVKAMKAPSLLKTTEDGTHLYYLTTDQ